MSAIRSRICEAAQRTPRMGTPRLDEARNSKQARIPNARDTAASPAVSIFRSDGLGLCFEFRISIFEIARVALRFLPEAVHFVRRGRVNLLAPFGEALLDVAEAADEAV